MYMYRAAVHCLDAELTVLEMTTSNAFFLVSSRFCTTSYMLLSCQRMKRLTFTALVASCVLGFSLEPDQTHSMIFVTI